MEGKEGDGWTTEQVRLLERVYIDFVRMGAKFDDATRVEYADIQGELPPVHPPSFVVCFAVIIERNVKHPCGGKCI